MSKIRIEDIRDELQENNWELISNEYINLDTEMKFQCPEGHIVYSSWKKLRQKMSCPLCDQNIYHKKDEKIIPKKKGTTRTFSLDQSTKINGWAIFDGKELVKYGKIELNGEPTERLFKVKEWFCSMINNWQPDLIGIEGIQFQENNGYRMGVTVFEALARLQGVLLETAYELKIPIYICPTNTWRGHCGVKGKTRTDKKKSMQLLVKQWYDVSITNDEADAIGIGKYTLETYHPTADVKIIDWE